MQLHGGKNWKQVADYFEGRSDVQCLHRWQKVLNPDLVKGPWTPEVTISGQRTAKVHILCLLVSRCSMDAFL